MNDLQRAGRTIEKQIFINAAPECVFEAFTSPAALAGWWSMAEAELGLRPGGRWRFRWTSGDEICGVIVDIDPPWRIVMDWDEGENLSTTRLTVEFVAEDAGTRVLVHDTGYGVGGDWDALYDGVNAGWSRALAGLCAWLERDAQPAVD